MSLLPQETLQQLISTHGYWTVALIVGLESMGIPLPGETVLEKWLHNFRQHDEWNLCLTAGTVVPANQERQ